MRSKPSSAECVMTARPNGIEAEDALTRPYAHVRTACPARRPAAARAFVCPLRAAEVYAPDGMRPSRRAETATTVGAGSGQPGQEMLSRRGTQHIYRGSFARHDGRYARSASTSPESSASAPGRVWVELVRLGGRSRRSRCGDHMIERGSALQCEELGPESVSPRWTRRTRQKQR